jgi:hypothetical protein
MIEKAEGKNLMLLSLYVCMTTYCLYLYIVHYYSMLLSHSLIWDIDTPDQVQEFWAKVAPTQQLLLSLHMPNN